METERLSFYHLSQYVAASLAVLAVLTFVMKIRPSIMTYALLGNALFYLTAMSWREPKAQLGMWYSAAANLIIASFIRLYMLFS